MSTEKLFVLVSPCKDIPLDEVGNYFSGPMEAQPNALCDRLLNSSIEKLCAHYKCTPKELQIDTYKYGTLIISKGKTPGPAYIIERLQDGKSFKFLATHIYLRG